MYDFLGVVTVFTMLWASVGTVLYGCLLDSLGWNKMSFEARLTLFIGLSLAGVEPGDLAVSPNGMSLLMLTSGHNYLLDAKGSFQPQDPTAKAARTTSTAVTESVS